MIPQKDEPIHQSIKNKIRTISSETGENKEYIFTRLVLERFLVRLEQSEYKENLIFKGGLCLSTFVNIGRETKDIDFLISSLKTTKSNIKNVFKKISDIELKDGFKFTKVDVKDLKNEKKYPGFRVIIKYSFGQTKNQIQIDLGIGDVVDPENINFPTLKTSKSYLFYPENIQIKAYSPEFIFSEKLETSIKRGRNNSRMKDYQDMFMIISSGILYTSKLKDSIYRTFENRKTIKTLIPSFNTQDLEILEDHWKRHINQLTNDIKNQLPPKFEDIYKYINYYLSNNSLI